MPLTLGLHRIDQFIQIMKQADYEIVTSLFNLALYLVFRNDDVVLEGLLADFTLLGHLYEHPVFNASSVTQPQRTSTLTSRLVQWGVCVSKRT